MNSRWLIASVFIFGVLLIAALWIWTSGDGSKDTVEAQLGTIDVTLQTVGTIRPSDEVVVRANSGGTIMRFGAEIGDRVEEGEIIAVLDRTQFDAALEMANRDLEWAEFDLQFAELRASESDDDSASLLDVLIARERVKIAEQQVRDARSALANSVILAPIDGIILDYLVSQNEILQASQPIARLYVPESMQLVVEIDELDIPNVVHGTEALFRLDAFPSVEISGTVSTTSPEAQIQGGATLFSAIVEFVRPEDLDIRPGMNASVTIITDARENILVIPDTAIKTVGDRHFVTVVESGRDVEREIRVGFRGNGLTEVVSGLTEGDRVVVEM